MASSEDNRIIFGLNDSDSIEEMRRRQASMGIRMQRLACTALEELEKKAKAGEPLNLSAADAQALLNAGQKLERAALGTAEPNDDTPSLKKPVN